MSRSIRLSVARAIGRAIGSGFPDERAHVRGNLARVLPEAFPAILNTAVGETFANFAACFVDLLTLNRRRPDAWLPSVARVEGADRRDAVFAVQRGAIADDSSTPDAVVQFFRRAKQLPCRVLSA